MLEDSKKALTIEISNSYENNILDNRYILQESLGSGSFGEVYKVLDIYTQKIMAAKIFKITKEDDKSFEKEEYILKRINEYETISCIKYYNSGIGTLIKDNIKQKIKYIIMEYGSKENLLDKIKKTSNGFSEEVGKYFLYKLIQGVKSLHKIGISHRDIKPENIVFVGDKYEIKLCDFGLAIPFLNEKNEKLYIKVPAGSKPYKAPEIIRKIPYDGEKSDIFSIGVTLFTFLTNKMPFQSYEEFSEINQSLYYLIYKNKIDEYWNTLETFDEIKSKALSPEFKELFIKMVKYSPKKRITLDEIMDSKWMENIKYASYDYLEMLRYKMIEEMH